MARVPRPTRTKRGVGAAAKLALTIDYYRAPDGAGPDFGSFYGRDDDGPWELKFEGEGELAHVQQQVVSALREVATEAREATADERAAAGRTMWLKSIGAQGRPVEEIWWDERDRDQGVDFPYRPKSVKLGDLLVVYAAGTRKLVGVLQVTSGWKPEGRSERWPYRVDTKILAAVPTSEGLPLDLLSDERPIGKSIRQKSHVKLSEGEAAKALEEFGLEPL